MPGGDGIEAAARLREVYVCAVGCTAVIGRGLVAPEAVSS
jgi:hypothetical protein